VGGRFESLVVGSDASGLARVSGYGGRFASAFVSAGGLCGPAFAAALPAIFMWCCTSKPTTFSSGMATT